MPRLDTGGAELSTIEIAAAVVRAGGRALVATEGGRMADRITAAGGELVEMAAGSKSPLVIWRNGTRLAALMRKEEVDIIHARSRAPAWSALRAARLSGKPFVTTYHGAYAEHGAVKRLYNSVMQRSDVVIANSRYTAELIKSRYGTADSRIRVIHRGVDPERFDPARVQPARVEHLRRRWGIGDGERIVLHAARVTGWKGQSVVIEAAERLKRARRHGNAVFVFAGDAQGRDSYLDELRARARAAGLEGAVRFTGHVDDMAAAFLAAEIAVVASTEPEAFGRAAAEAEAMGCPVISTNIGAPPETVLAEPAVPAAAATGWLVPPGDVGALADRIDLALSMSEPERRAMGARARAHVAANFTLDAMRLATLRVYDELIGSRLASAFASGAPG